MSLPLEHQASLEIFKRAVWNAEGIDRESVVILFETYLLEKHACDRAKEDMHLYRQTLLIQSSVVIAGSVLLLMLLN